MLGLPLELVLVVWVLLPGAGLSVLGAIATANRAERRSPASEPAGPVQLGTSGQGPLA